MKIYRVQDDYIKYLRTKEKRVLENKNERIPYVGIILTVNNLNYFVPLSSPKPKHKTMKNTKDFHKIANGIYGAINFNKIIPVPTECIINFRFENEEDQEYRLLLQNQYKIIKDMMDIIENKTKRIYEIFHTNDKDLTPADLKVKRRCCNFDLLEKMCKEYKKSMILKQETK